MSTNPALLQFYERSSGAVADSYDFKDKNASIVESLTKNNIVVPIPQDERIGIDIGMTTDHSFRITWVGSAGTPSSGASIVSMKNYCGKLSNLYDFKFTYRDQEFWVLPNNLSTTDEAGKGDILQCSIALDVIKQRT